MQRRTALSRNIFLIVTVFGKFTHKKTKSVKDRWNGSLSHFLDYKIPINLYF